jgi:two-component system, cell cycle sensor histidine kinase and response regulator CckA
MNHELVLLVVDDDAAVRRFTAMVLENSGYQVIAVDTAVNCLWILEGRAGAIDLVITDLMMPGMGGLDLGAELARRYPAVKVLYISGYCTSIAVQGIAHIAPHLILAKPFTADELIFRVGRLCS